MAHYPAMYPHDYCIFMFILNIICCTCTLFTLHHSPPNPPPPLVACRSNILSPFEISFLSVKLSHAYLTFCSIQMANDINNFVDNMHLNISNSFSHMLDTENSDELIVIRYSPYITDNLLFQSRENRKLGLSIVSLNCQSLHAKFDYIQLLIDKFMKNDCPLQAMCLQKIWFPPETDQSLYIIPGYHMIFTGHYASNHGSLAIYLYRYMRI